MAVTWDAVTRSCDVIVMLIRWSMVVPFGVQEHTIHFDLLLPDGNDLLPAPMLTYTEGPLVAV